MVRRFDSFHDINVHKCFMYSYLCCINVFIFKDKNSIFLRLLILRCYIVKKAINVVAYKMDKICKDVVTEEADTSIHLTESLSDDDVIVMANLENISEMEGFDSVQIVGIDKDEPYLQVCLYQ